MTLTLDQLVTSFVLSLAGFFPCLLIEVLTAVVDPSIECIGVSPLPLCKEIIA